MNYGNPGHCSIPMQRGIPIFEFDSHLRFFFIPSLEEARNLCHSILPNHPIGQGKGFCSLSSKTLYPINLQSNVMSYIFSLKRKKKHNSFETSTCQISFFARLSRGCPNMGSKSLVRLSVPQRGETSHSGKKCFQFSIFPSRRFSKHFETGHCLQNGAQCLSDIPLIHRHNGVKFAPVFITKNEQETTHFCDKGQDFFHFLYRIWQVFLLLTFNKY